MTEIIGAGPRGPVQSNAGQRDGLRLVNTGCSRAGGYAKRRLGVISIRSETAVSQAVQPCWRSKCHGDQRWALRCLLSVPLRPEHDHAEVTCTLAWDSLVRGGSPC